MTYKYEKGGLAVIRLCDNATIPFDRGNVDYIKYLEWCDSGGITAPHKTQAELDAEAVEIKNNMIKAQMAEADLKIIRALVEGDKDRIDAYKLDQEERRKQLNE